MGVLEKAINEVANKVTAIRYINAGEIPIAFAHERHFEKPSTKIDRLTICVITLENGFNFIGQSHCCDPDEYSKQVGQKMAYEDALKQAVNFEVQTKIDEVQ